MPVSACRKGKKLQSGIDAWRGEQGYPATPSVSTFSGQLSQCATVLSVPPQAGAEACAPDLAQVNPLAETVDGELVAADAKLGFDDNAAFRQKELFAMRDSSQEDPRRGHDHASFSLRYSAALSSEHRDECTTPLHQALSSADSLFNNGSVLGRHYLSYRDEGDHLGRAYPSVPAGMHAKALTACAAGRWRQARAT